MIKRVPLKRDPPGQCGRWRVIVYNKETKKFDWHTVRGTRADAKALERKFEDAKRKGEYTGPLERRTFEEVANLFLDDRRANLPRVRRPVFGIQRRRAHRAAIAGIVG